MCGGWKSCREYLLLGMLLLVYVRMEDYYMRLSELEGKIESLCDIHSQVNQCIFLRNSNCIECRVNTLLLSVQEDQLVLMAWITWQRITEGFHHSRQTPLASDCTILGPVTPL